MFTAFYDFITKLTARVEGNDLTSFDNGSLTGLRIAARTLVLLLN